MVKAKLSDNEQVTQFIKTSSHSLSDVMQTLREIILSSSAEISEHIKWNAPAFYYNGQIADFNAKEYKRDIVVYNIRKNNYILLIFPTGNVIDNTTGILEGNYTDGRRMVTINSMDDLNTKKESLKAVIKNWLSKVEK